MTARVMWIELNHGGDGLTRVLAECSPELRATIEGGMRKAAWYPLAQMLELCVVIDRVLGVGDLGLVRELGRQSCDANLTTIYRLFFKLGSVHWILGRAVRLWSAHYDSGYLEVMTRGPHAAVARVRAFAQPDPVHCLSLAGWIERSIELSGGHDARVVESKCRTRGDELCQLELEWV